MSPKQVNELFEFPLEGTIGPNSFESFCEGVGEKGFVAKQFWKEVTGRSDWVVGFTKSFAFVNPVIRLLHRLLLQVFYPKGETGQVATNDFQMLWWFVHGDSATKGQLDFGRFLIAAFIWERDHNTGSITMGSFITVFAKHFGVALPSSTALAGHALLDIRQMEHNYKCLVHRGDKNYEWFVKGEGKDANKVLYANLPCPATHLSNPNALLFKPGDSYSPPTAAVEPSAETDDLFAHKAYVPRDQSTPLGPTHPYSRMSRPKVFYPYTPPLAPVTTREFRLFMDCFVSFSQDVIAQFDALEWKVAKLASEVVSLHQQLEASGPTACTADVISEAHTE
ncbi:Cullin-9 [Bienertia sinuspersici]